MGDIVEFDLDSVAVDPKGRSFYLERFIHGKIYKARPDVMAVVHNHSPAVISFGIGSTPLRPVFHQAAFILDGVPVRDYRDFGTADGALVNNAARVRLRLDLHAGLPGPRRLVFGSEQAIVVPHLRVRVPDPVFPECH